MVDDYSSTVELWFNLDKIVKKTCLVPLEAQFYVLYV